MSIFLESGSIKSVSYLSDRIRNPSRVYFINFINRELQSYSFITAIIIKSDPSTKAFNSLILRLQSDSE